MNPGKLDTQITIRRATSTRQANGSIVKTWADVAVVLASVEPINGREAIIAQQLSASAELKATIRWTDDVTAADRVAISSTVYEISRPPVPVGTRRSFMELWIVEAKP
jgi:SPP1 family predicted phage head-tail adaptor